MGSNTQVHETVSLIMSYLNFLLPVFSINLPKKGLNLFINCLTFFQGFGAGNFKALFEAIEVEQFQRGNL